METVKDTLGTLARNRYALLALVALATVGPGIVRLAGALRALQH